MHGESKCTYWSTDCSEHDRICVSGLFDCCIGQWLAGGINGSLGTVSSCQESLYVQITYSS